MYVIVRATVLDHRLSRSIVVFQKRERRKPVIDSSDQLLTVVDTVWWVLIIRL